MSSSTSSRAKRRAVLLSTVVAVGSVLTQVAPLPAAAAGVRGASPARAGVGETTLTIGDLPGWHQVFADDFTKDVPLGKFPSAASQQWGAYPSPWKDSTRHGTYSPLDVVSVANGVLNKRIHTTGSTHKIAALLPKVAGPARGQLYGRFAARWRADHLPGYKVAWLLWPDSGRGPATVRSTSRRWTSTRRPSQGTSTVRARRAATTSRRRRSRSDPNEWHTTVVEWSPDLVVFKLDGVEVGRSTTRIPNTPMHWVLQTETKLGGKRPAKSVAGNVQIDWVSIWSYAPKSVAPTAAPPSTPAPTVAPPSTPAPTVAPPSTPAPTVAPPSTPAPTVAPPTTAPRVPAPSVAVTEPAAGAVVSAAVRLGAEVANAASVTSVKWYVDGLEVAYTAAGAPWRDSWNTKSVANGPHRIFSKARLADGQWITSPVLTIAVANG